MTDRTKSNRPQPTGRSDESGSLIIFDGVCVLCSGFARLVVRLDRRRRFRFATAQSSFGAALFARHGLRTDSYETNLVLIDGVAFTHLDGAIAVLGELGWPWRLAKALLVLPRPLRDRIYGVIARNRYALFGKRDNCEVPSAELRSRLIA